MGATKIVAAVMAATARIATAAQVDLSYSPTGVNVLSRLVHGFSEVVVEKTCATTQKR